MLIREKQREFRDRHPEEDRQTCREEAEIGGDVTSMAETGVTWPQAKDRLEPTEAGKGKEGILP